MSGKYALLLLAALNCVLNCSNLYSQVYLDHPQLDTSIPLDNPASALVSLKIARSGIVLLKNDDNVLPLDQNSIQKIAVIGPNGNSYVTGGGSSYTDPYHSVSVTSALRSLARTGTTITFDNGLIDDDSVFGTSRYFVTIGSGLQGLRAEYFNNQYLSGAPFFTGTNSMVNFGWGAVGPSISGFTNDHFSIRWSGVIRPPTTGKYEFIVRCDDGCRLC